MKKWIPLCEDIREMPAKRSPRVVLSFLDDKLNTVRCLSGNQVKVIAVCSMVVDHFCKVVMLWLAANVLDDAAVAIWNNQLRLPMESVGRMAFPLFCFLLTEGFRHSQHRKKYFCLLLGFALISEIPFDRAFFTRTILGDETSLFYWGYQNVFFTLLLGLAAMLLLEKVAQYRSRGGKKGWCAFLALGSAALPALAAEGIRSDYGAYGVILIVAMYLCRRNRILQVLAALVVAVLFTGEQPALFQVLAYVVILLYNGKRGKCRMKYFFYIFYPAHLALFDLLIERILPWACHL